MGNYGKINQDKLKAAAKRAGISTAELDKALQDRNLSGVTFTSGGTSLF